MLKRKNSIGLTLIELILALTLSLFLISLSIEIYLLAEKSQRAQAALISLQENQQILSQILRQHIRMAGFSGCGRFSSDFPFYNHLPQYISLNNKIAIYPHTDIKTNTDGITLWHAGIHHAKLSKNMQGYATLYVTANPIFAVGDNLIISDCKSVDLFKVKRVIIFHDGTQQIIAKTPLSKLYAQNAEISEFEWESYFVGDTGRLDLHEQPVYAVFMETQDGQKTELIEGVESMQIELASLEHDTLVIHKMGDVSDAAAVLGVSFTFKSLQKEWHTYVSLR